MSDMLSVEAALAHLLQAARPPAETETLPAEACLGRVLGQDLDSGVTVPAFVHAATDGYAARAADGAPQAWLPVSGGGPAGAQPSPLEAGSAARIFTGAPVPEGADVVVMQEDCETRDGQVRIQRAPRPGDHLRRAGEDIRAGQTVLAAGTRLGPAQLGVAASVGAAIL